jgi:hypothetical protein
LLVTSAFSHLLPSALQGLQRCAVPRRVLRGHFVTRLFERWTWHGTACVIGKFCQVTFPTMANVGLSPMMCYKHPGRHPRPRPQEQLGTVRNSGQERHWTVDMYHKCIIHQCERSGSVLILGVVRLFFLQNNITVWEPDESTRVLHLQRTPETSEKSYRISSGFMCHGWNIPDLYMTFQVQYINIGV